MLKMCIIHVHVCVSAFVSCCFYSEVATKPEMDRSQVTRTHWVAHDLTRCAALCCAARKVTAIADDDGRLKPTSYLLRPNALPWVQYTADDVCICDEADYGVWTGAE